MDRNMKRRLFQTLRAAVFAALLCLAAGVPAGAQQPVPPVMGASHLALLPYLDAFIDTSGNMDVEEVAAPENAHRFMPLNLRSLPLSGGVAWLRLVIAPLPEGGKADKILLDMGDDIPGAPTFYTATLNPLSNTLEWQENDRSRVQLLPEAGAEAQTCYIRLDGLPGFWFSPTLRTPQDATTNWGGLAHTGATLALGVVMLLCLLRGFTEKGQWRIWTSLYVAVALAQSVLGMPAIADGRIPMNEAAAALAPGVALMLLPHVARHFLDTRRASRSLDVQYMLLSLPGVVLALTPLLPDFAWMTRFLPLWPAATVLFVPTTLGACLMGLGGGARFLLACLLQTLAVGAAFAGMDFGYPSAVLASLPYWGTALGALLVAGTATPRRKRAPDENDATAIPVAPPDDDFLSLDMPPAAGQPAEGGAEDPGLIINIADFEGATAPEKPATRTQTPPAPAAAPAPAPAPAQPAAPAVEAGKFNLQQLLREAHDAVAAEAERKNIGLSWYMPPNLPQLYAGDGEALATVLRTLLNSSVRATSRGAVQFSARRVRDSNDPGRLLFNVNDTGSGMPPSGRSSTALARAADLAGAHGGFFEAECGPQGASVSFSLHFRPVEEELESPSSAAPRPGIMVVAPNVAARSAIIEALSGMPCAPRQASSLGGAISLNMQRPASVLIVCGQEASPASRGLVERFREAGRKLPHFGAIAVTDDDRTWDMLADAGFTHALLAPPNPAALRATVEEILSGRLDADIAELPAPAPAKEKPARGIPDLFDAPAAPRPMPAPPAAARQTPATPPPAPKAANAHAEADDIVAAEEARLRQTRRAPRPEPAPAVSRAAASRPAPAPEPAPAPRPAAPVPAPQSASRPAPAPQPAPAPARAATVSEDLLDDLPDFVRGEEPEERVTLPSSHIKGPWVTSDGEASPALKDAWKQPSRSPAPQRRPSVPFTPTPRGAGSGADAEVGDPMPIPRARRQTPPVARTRPAATAARQPQPAASARPLIRAEEGMPAPDPSYSEARAAMLRRADMLLKETQTAYNEGRPQHAAMTALDIAKEMEAFGIRHIARLARNVERAGTAGDMEALGDILPELYNAMERLYIQLDRR